MDIFKNLTAHQIKFVKIYAEGGFKNQVGSLRKVFSRKKEYALTQQACRWMKLPNIQKAIEFLRKEEHFKEVESLLKKKEDEISLKEEEVDKKNKVILGLEKEGGGINRVATEDEIIVSKNPLIFNSLINLGIIKCLFSSVTLDTDKKGVAKAEINYHSWAILPFVKDLVARNLLNKEMFESKVKPHIKSPAVNVQFNNLNNGR